MLKLGKQAVPEEIKEMASNGNMVKKQRNVSYEHEFT